MLVAAMALLVAWEPWRPLPPDDQRARPTSAPSCFPISRIRWPPRAWRSCTFDEDTATMRPFKVAQVNGVWSIPSHSNYPADAREHMAEAATALLDLEILSVASDERRRPGAVWRDHARPAEAQARAWSASARA